MYKNKKIERMDTSTIEKGEYIGAHIFFGGLLGCNLLLWLPVLCPIADYHQSVLRLVLCMIVMSMFGMILTYEHHRTYYGVIGDLFAGLGVYTLLTLGAYKVTLVKWMLGIWLVLTVIDVLLIFKPKIENKEAAKQIIRRRIYRSLLLVKKNTALICGIALIMIPTAVHFTSEKDIMNTFYQVSGYETTGSSASSSYSVIEVYDDRYQLSENIEIIKLIRNNDTFQVLDYEKKCEVVQAILYCEARYLGLCEVNLEFKELKDSTLGQYNHQTKTITINSKPLKDGTMPGGTNTDVLKTVVHECRHCYQELLAELYVHASPEQRNLYVFTSEGVAAWIENFGEYHTVKDDSNMMEYSNYRNQALEQDARNWEQIELIDYFYRIDELTATKDNDESAFIF